MKKTSLSTLLMIAVASTAVLAGCKKNEPAAPAPAPEASVPAPVSEPAPVAAAVSVTSVTVGNAIAEDKSVAPVATFAATDKIIVSVKTQGTADNVAVAAKLTYQDGQTAGEQSVPLNTTDDGTTNLEFAKASPWPAGTYTAAVTVDGQPAGSAQTFEVK